MPVFQQNVGRGGKVSAATHAAPLNLSPSPQFHPALTTPSQSFQAPTPYKSQLDIKGQGGAPGIGQDILKGMLKFGAKTALSGLELPSQVIARVNPNNKFAYGNNNQPLAEGGNSINGYNLPWIGNTKSWSTDALNNENKVISGEMSLPQFAAESIGKPVVGLASLLALPEIAGGSAGLAGYANSAGATGIYGMGNQLVDSVAQGKNVQDMLGDTLKSAIPNAIGGAVLHGAIKAPGAIASKIAQFGENKTINPAIESLIKPQENTISQQVTNYDAGKGVQSPSPIQIPGFKPSGDVIPSGFSSTVKNSSKTPDELKSLMDGTHNVLHDEPRIQAAKDFIANTPNAESMILDRNSQLHPAMRTTAAQLYAKDAIANGDIPRASQFANIAMNDGTDYGQAIHALADWNKTEPEGVLKYAHGQIEAFNKENPTKTISLSASNAAKLVKSAQDMQGLTGIEAERAKQKLLVDVARLVPSTTMKKAVGLFRSGLLTGPQTFTKITTTLGLQAPQKAASNLFTAGADAIHSLVTGKPRQFMATTEGIIPGFKGGAQAGVDLVKTGFENPNYTNREFNPTNHTFYDNKALQMYADKPGASHGGVTMPFYGAFKENDLASMVKADGYNKGLRGQELSAYTKDYMKNATPEMLQSANNAAGIDTFNQKTLMGKMAGEVQHAGGGAGGFIMPFTQKPSSILTSAMDATPIGLRHIFDKSESSFALKEKLQAVGRTVPGTTIAALGGYMLNQGKINLDYPTDAKTQALWKAEGRRSNTIKVGDKWINISALGPVGEVLTAGAYVANGGKTDLGTAITNGLTGLGNTAMNMPYLAEANAITNAITNPQKDALRTGEQLAGGFVPTAVSDLASSIDPMQGRQINGIQDALKYRIPGLRQSLLPTTDTLGNQPANQEGFRNFIDPFKGRTQNSDPLLNELQRLDDAGTNASIAEQKTSSIPGFRVKMTPEEYTRMQTETGRMIKNFLNQVVSNPQYQQLSDYEKANTINKVVTQVNSAWDRQNVGKLSGSRDQIKQELQKQIKLKAKPYF